MRTVILTNMFPDSNAPYLGTFVKDTVIFFGSDSKVVYPGNAFREKKIYFYCLLYWSAIVEILRSERVVVHYPLFFSPLIVIAFILRRKIVLVYHGGEFMERPWSSVLFRFFQRLTMSINNWCANDILLPSVYVAEEFFSAWKSKVKVWYSGGIRASDYLLPENFDFDFVFVGRNSNEKGYDCFLSALSASEIQASECSIAIASRDVTIPYVEKLGRLKVHYFPPMRQSDITAFLSRSRFVVIPSRVESLCLLALEAASVGVVVLARALDPIKETLGDSAIYFDLDAELPNVMADAVDISYEVWKTRASRLKEKSKKFNRDIIYENFTL